MEHIDAPAGSPSPPVCARPVICIVDDDPDLLAALRFSLEIDGFVVRTYHSGEAMLAREHEDLDASCFIVDQLLPGLNGLELLDALRKRGATGPAILITTHPRVAVRERAARLGVPIVEKPLLGDTLVRAVREQIGPGAP